MKKIKWFLLVCVVVMMAFTFVACGEKKNTEESDNITYKRLSDGTYSIERDKYASGDYVISTTFKGQPITRIGKYAYIQCNGLKSVTIPDTVTVLDAWSLNDCGNLETVYLPASIKTVGVKAFDMCYNLQKVYYAGDVTSWCEVTFESDTSNPMRYAKELYFGETLVSDLVIPDNVTTIKDYAFHCANSITSVAIPDSVTSIGNEAFHACADLKTLTLGKGVTDLNDNAFSVCKIENATIPMAALPYIPTEKLKTVVLTDGTSIAPRAFFGLRELTTVTIPSSVTSIGSNAFGDCFLLKDVYFNGTRAQWDAVEKATDWAYQAGDHTVHCTDDPTE